MSSKDYYKQEIAKKFDLPERKSKIATLLKEAELYCLCRSSDCTQFMIACDGCEEWYHGDCVNITESDSRYIKKYYCPPCMEKDPSLEIEYKKKSISSQRTKSKSSDKGHDSRGSSSKSSSKLYSESSRSKEYADSRRCGSCSGCLAVTDCFKCDVCIRNKYDDKRRGLCRKRECQNEGYHYDVGQEDRKPSMQVLSERQIDATDEEDDWVPSPIQAKKQKPATPSRSRKKQQGGAKDSQRWKNREPRRPPTSSSECSDSEEDKQCYGLDCVNPARKNSKYCSQECCIKLATERLYRILPGRIQEWNLTSAVADEHNQRDLERNQNKQTEARTKISELEKKRADMDDYIARVEQLTVDPDVEDDEHEEEGIISCITCGHEIPVRTCLKHMERCYNKYESQTCFGSIYKCRIEGIKIFCDYYNPATGIYCKRLAVLCPEHSKERKIGDTEVCGYPLDHREFEGLDNICRLPKKKCNKHFCWEKLRRAEIDMERVRQWLKLDELVEQERQIRIAMNNRGGVMGLLLHSTFDHEVRSRLQHQAIEEQAAERQEDVDVEGNNISDEEPIVRNPLTKSREHQRRNTVETDERKAMTASKLYQKTKSSAE